MTKLDIYYSKRDFRRTREPKGKIKQRSGRRFVIQKHAASRLHYDLRLEIDGVLVSWAVPKGPSMNPKEKRLAIQTEDHPMEYADFEGVIPEGEYGGGTVMVWDDGSYKNLRAAKGDNEKRRSMEESLEDGLLEVWLDGEKLQGGFALKRIRNGKKPQWLLIKMDDKQADARRKPVNTQTRSVKSGRDLDAITQQEGEDKENA